MAASPTPVGTPETTRRLIYDGDCGFCTTSATWFAQRIAGTPDAIAPWQSLDLDALGLTEAAVNEAVHWVTEDGQTYKGHEAVGHAIRIGRQPLPLLGRALMVPPVSWIAAGAYRLIARYRYKLPGSTDACRI